MSKPTSLYLLFNADKDVIYIGVTSLSMHRLAQHAADKPWWQEVVWSRFFHFDTRKEALEAERRAIKSFRPCYNTIHMKDPKPKREPKEPHLELIDALNGVRRSYVRNSGPYKRSGIG
jgi:predicted GIY-YIG superfamily endonuclease